MALTENKMLVAGIVIVVLVLALAVYLIAPIVVIVPPKSAAVIVPAGHIAVIVPQNATAAILPAVNIASGTPKIVFIGITTIDPVDLAKFQDVRNNIVVTFTEAMDPATVNQDTFVVKGPGNASVRGTITPDATDKVWTFSPTDDLASDSVFTIRITTGAKGVSGNALVEDFVWSFTTTYVNSITGFERGAPPELLRSAGTPQ
jgi:hypothetical protein